MSLAFHLQMRPGKVEPGQPPLPPLASRVGGASRICVVVELSPHVSRRVIGKWISLKQRRHRRLVLQEALEKPRKPRILFRDVKRGEPHLPVEPRLMGMFQGGRRFTSPGL